MGNRYSFHSTVDIIDIPFPRAPKSQPSDPRFGARKERGNVGTLELENTGMHSALWLYGVLVAGSQRNAKSDTTSGSNGEDWFEAHATSITAAVLMKYPNQGFELMEASAANAVIAGAQYPVAHREVRHLRSHEL